MAPDRALPVIFEMVHPICGLDQRRPLPDSGISQPYPIECSAIADLLHHPDAVEIHTVDFDWTSDIFEVPQPQLLEREGELFEQMVMRLARKVDPTGLGDGLKPGGNINAVAIEVVAIDDDIAEIDADAKLYAFFTRNRGVSFVHATLHLDRAAHGIDHARKLNQNSVTGGLHHP